MRSRDSVRTEQEPPKRRRRIPALIAVAIAGVLLFPPSGQAAPTQQQEDPAKKLDELEKRADALAEKYRGQIHELDAATEAARRAEKRGQKLARRQGEARDRVAELASARYKSGGVDPIIAIAGSGSPQGMLDRMATAQHIARTSDERLRQLKRLQREAQGAQQEARAQVERVQQIVDRLESRKDEVAELIAKYEAQEEARKKREARQREQREARQREQREARREAAQNGSNSAGSSGGGSAASSSGGGGDSASASQPKSSRTGDGQITSRTRGMLDKIDGRFGPFPSIGCYRSGSSGEHPKGRACDFMLSTGGSMPSSGNVDKGWQVAKWARNNASDLGVMYVIYRQQIWDSRSGGGWRPMEDRGSTTQNHYDHVHISMF